MEVVLRQPRPLSCRDSAGFTIELTGLDPSVIYEALPTR